MGSGARGGKPQWLKDRESHATRVLPDPETCGSCANIGRPVKLTRHKGAEWTEVYECAVNPGCFNTRFSICCNDWTAA